MRQLAAAIGLAVVLAATAVPMASAEPTAEQPVVEHNCGLQQIDVPTTTTSVPTSTSAVPTPECPVPGNSALITPTTTDVIVAPTAPIEVVTAAPPIDTTTTKPSETTTAAVQTDATTTVPTVTTTPTATTTDAPKPAARAAAPAAAAENLLNIQVPSMMTGPSTVTPGTTWTGTMSMAVLGVGIAGWKSDISMSSFRGKNTGRTLTPTSATYSAPSTGCTLGGTSDGVTLGLSATPVLAKKGGGLCITSWTSTVSIAVPSAGVIADTYTATLTHSIY